MWRRIIADALNVTVERINSSEGPAFGAAILAAVGAGMFPTVEKACEAYIKATDVCVPDPDAAARYAGNHKIYKGLYASMKDMYTKMADINRSN
jgi:xylulokinase